MTARKFFKLDRSTWIILPFFLLVVLMALYSEVFKIPLHSAQDQALANPFKGKNLTNAESILLKNRQGEFQVKNDATEGKAQWSLASPRSFPANPQVIDRIFDLLRSLKIKRQLTPEDVNLGNFSFQNPLLSLQLKLPGEVTPLRIDVGLINTIDQSAYVTFQGKPTVYQIEMPKISLDSFEAQSFSEIDLFPLNMENVSEVSLYRGKGQREALFKLKKDGPRWLDQNQRELSSVKVAEFLVKVFSQKGAFISEQIFKDNAREEARALTHALSNPGLELVLTLGTTEPPFTYTISNAGPYLGQSPVEKGQQVVVRPTVAGGQEGAPVIVGKHLLQILNVKANDFLPEG